ncbi:MAG TPA: LppX_LprAFG lipoprotein [Thermomicrobiales bacterium]|nr:LppX_LprAFG lipoprotein [Thermomicrobiales bacterium]
MPLFRRRFVMLLGVSGVLALVACSPSGQEPSTPTPAPTPGPAALLEMASRRLAEIPTVHFALEVQGETFIDTGRNIRLLGAEGDLQRPDRVHTTFQAEVLNRAISLQLITIGDRSWTTNILTGEWENAPVEFAYRPDILFSTQDGIGPVMGRVEDVARLEDEDVAGRPTYHLRATVDQSIVGPLTYHTITGSPVTVDLWIDRETHDLLRARISEPPGPERPNPAVWTLDLSQHGEELGIAPPV